MIGLPRLRRRTKNAASTARIAERGLAYTSFHTIALCSPTRSCLMTGRNHTTNGMGCITEATSGFPDANGHIPFECANIAEVLRERGWNTYHVGKPWSELDRVRPWDSLPDDERRLFSRMAEVYAGFVSHADHELGRLLDHFFNGLPDGIEDNLKQLDELGGTRTYNHYPTGWAWAFNTPFKMWKRYANDAGGTADPLIVSWPKGIERPGGLRRLYCHAGWSPSRRPTRRRASRPSSTRCSARGRSGTRDGRR